jgi:site-specific recombinase XerD
MFLLQRENGAYYIQYVDPVTKKYRRKSIGTKSKKEAMAFFKQFEPLPQQPLNLIKLSEFRDEYIKYAATNKTKKYSKSIKLSFRQLMNYSKDVSLQNLTPRILDQFLAERYSTAPSAASLYYRTLKAAFSKAVVWGSIDANPLKKIKPPKHKKSFPVFISKSDLELIINQTSNRLLQEIFITAFYSGMRLGEILNLVWACIDFNRKVILIKNINGFVTKSKKERVIPMNNRLLDLFLYRYQTSKRVNQNDYIFYRVIGVKLNEDFVSKQFKKAVRSAGLSDEIHFHILRHSFASNLIQKGASIYVVKELLGHESISTTQIYSHLQSENLSQAVSLLDE